MSEVTQVIEAIPHGDAEAADELLPLVYEELRKLAVSNMASEAAGNTLQPTALVHEASHILLREAKALIEGQADLLSNQSKGE